MKKGILVHPEELDGIWIEEALKRGYSSIGLHPVGGGEAHESFAAAVRLSEDARFRSLVDTAEDKGLRIEYEMHALRYLLPANEFSAHPDWFRENAEGVRTPDRNCCATNEEALAYVGESAARAARKLYTGKKASHRHFFWTDDVHDMLCSCARCRSLTASDKQLMIMNAIVRRLRKDDPKAEVAFLAYDVCALPPENVEPEEGIFLEIAPMNRDFHKPLYGSDDARNTERCRDIEKLIAYFGAGNTKILDYWLDNSCYSGWTKPPKKFTPDNDVIKADIEYYDSLGINEVTTFACYLGADYRELYGMPDLGCF